MRLCARYIRTMIARPMTTSATVSAMEKRANPWPCSVPGEAREGDQVDVDPGVGHQLDGNQDRERVLAGEHAIEADAKEQRAQQEVGGEPGGLSKSIHHGSTFRARAMAPTMALSRSESSSNGKTRSRRKYGPKASVSGGSVATTRAVCSERRIAVAMAPKTASADSNARPLFSDSWMITPSIRRVSMTPNSIRVTTPPVYSSTWTAARNSASR